MNNKALWDSVKVTDPSVVKAITGKSYQGSSPKPYWLIERATEVFGPIGIGWGVDVVSERFERMSEDDVLHVAVVSVWYVQDGVRSQSFEQMGGTKACYRTSKGSLMIDEDAGKKSVTDGMVKCLSMIGFAGDIFSGQWNDSKYVDWAAEQYKDKNHAAERDAWLAAQRSAIAGAKNVGELKKIFAAAVHIAEQNSDDDAITQLTAARDAKMGPVITPRGGIGDNLPEDMKIYLRDLAQEATDFVKQGNLRDALERIAVEELDDEQRVYLEGQIDSKTRAALKKPVAQA